MCNVYIWYVNGCWMHVWNSSNIFCNVIYIFCLHFVLTKSFWLVYFCHVIAFKFTNHKYKSTCISPINAILTFRRGTFALFVVRTIISDAFPISASKPCQIHSSLKHMESKGVLLKNCTAAFLPFENSIIKLNIFLSSKTPQQLQDRSQILQLSLYHFIQYRHS
jgi:hypothetical protein